MSQVSCGQFEIFASLINGAVKAVESVAQCGAGGCRRFGEFRQPGAEQQKIGAAEEHCDVQSLAGELVSIGFGDALDQTMQSKTTQIVAHASRAIVLGVDAEKAREMRAQLRIRESLRLYAEQHERVEQRLGTRLAEAQRGGALRTYFDGANHLSESVFADGAVVRDGLDAEQTSVGLKADRAQRGQVAQVLADPEIARIVDRRLGAQSPAFLVVLLDTRSLVIDVQRRDHPVGDHAGTKATGRAPADATLEDQLRLTRPADIQGLANDATTHAAGEATAVNQNRVGRYFFAVASRTGSRTRS
jgi:hypothetical protein